MEALQCENILPIEMITKSAGNVDRVTVRTASDVNALDIVAARRVVVMQDAVATLEDRLS